MNERAKGTAVFPAGLILRLEGDGAVLGNQGDVVIEGDLSSSLGKIKHVFSESGSLTVAAAEFGADRIEAAGEVRLEGNVKAKRIKGGSVHLSGGKVVSQVILGDQDVELGSRSIKADVVIAPQVTFNPDTKGRVVAVECQNDLGPSKVRGRLSLVDYVDIVAGATEVLEANDIPIPEGSDDDEEDEDEEPEERGLAPPGDEAQEPDTDTVAQAGDDDLAGLGLDEDDEEDVSEDLEMDSAGGEPSGDPPPGADLPSTEMMASEVHGSAGIKGLDDGEVEALAQQLIGALGKIEEAYNKEDVPPPVVFLKSLVEEGRLDYVKVQINSIWSDLLKYHQKKGLYISNAVTHQFQQIQMAKRKIPE